MADAMMMFLGEAHGVNWYWAQPGEFENPGAYYWDGAKNVLCVPHISAPEAPAQNDPMDTPLPCDVRIGNGIHRKGTSLRTLVNRAQRLHEAAFGPAPTKEEAAANLEQLRSAVIAPAQASAVDEREAPEVTEFNVGRWCLSEDDCIEQGIDFAAYERGVADAATAFGRNRARVANGIGGEGKR